MLIYAIWIGIVLDLLGVGVFKSGPKSARKWETGVGNTYALASFPMLSAKGTVAWGFD